jgi:Vps51/EXO84/COG1 N-terminal
VCVCVCNIACVLTDVNRLFSALGEESVRNECLHLQRRKEVAAKGLQSNVFIHYRDFIGTSKEISGR